MILNRNSPLNQKVGKMASLVTLHVETFPYLCDECLGEGGPVAQTGRPAAGGRVV